MNKVTWFDVETYIASLEPYLPKNPSGVYGIPRGGNILATLISYYYDIPLLQAPAKGCIVVDDIADTGETLLHYKSKGYFITTMYYHKQSKVVPDIWFAEKNDEWIVYPWETTKG